MSKYIVGAEWATGKDYALQILDRLDALAEGNVYHEERDEYREKVEWLRSFIQLADFDQLTRFAKDVDETLERLC